MPVNREKSMSKEHTIDYVENPEESAWNIIGRGLSIYNHQQTGDRSFERICFVLRSQEGEIEGGAIGELYYGWFHLDLLWVKDELRGDGYGHALLMRIEEEARQRGAKNIFLDTFSFQAPEFYKRYGYQEFAVLPDYPPGHRRHFMKKEL
jgi:GNAT superfamily N-acetyltransferase